MPNQIEDVLTLKLPDFSPSVWAPIEQSVKASDVKKLAMRIDRILFGKKGSLAASIKAQGRGGQKWDELDADYKEWKTQAAADRVKLPEIPPNMVISDKIWIRTGKFLQFTETVGNKPSKFKILKVYPQNMFAGQAFFEVYADQIDYWRYVHEGNQHMPPRPIAFFEKKDIQDINEIWKDWLEEIIARWAIRHGLMSA